MPQAITDKSLAAFGRWLLERGRSEGTVEVYQSSLRQCAHTPALTSRLVDKDLAPKTRRTSLAALAAWANYTDDPKLTKHLKEIRLPPSVRVKAKIRMEVDEWKKFVRATQRDKKLGAPVRVVILIMALRGLRSGDALRIRKREVGDALKTGKLSFEGKGRKRHEIAAKPIYAELEALYAERGSWERVRDLFGKHGHARSVSNTVARAVKRIAKKAKIDGVHPHRLRRTMAHLFLDKLGPDPRAIQKLQAYMGWSNVATALGYVDDIAKADVDAIGAEMLGDLLG